MVASAARTLDQRDRSNKGNHNETETAKRVRLNTHVPSALQSKFEETLGCRVLAPTGVAFGRSRPCSRPKIMRNMRRRFTSLFCSVRPASVDRNSAGSAFQTHGHADAFIQINAAATRRNIASAS